MTPSAGLNETLKALRPLTSVNDTEKKCYKLVELLDQLLSSRDYVTHNQSTGGGQITRCEVIPASTRGHAMKLTISTLLAELTEPIRRNAKSTVDLSVLTQAGNPVSIQKINLDEWVVTVNTSRGELCTRFIEA